MVGQVKCVKPTCSEAAEAIDQVHFHLSSSEHLYINLINVNRINLNLSDLWNSKHRALKESRDEAPVLTDKWMNKFETIADQAFVCYQHQTYLIVLFNKWWLVTPLLLMETIKIELMIHHWNKIKLKVVTLILSSSWFMKNLGK